MKKIAYLFLLTASLLINLSLRSSSYSSGTLSTFVTDSFTACEVQSARNCFLNSIKPTSDLRSSRFDSNCLFEKILEKVKMLGSSKLICVNLAGNSFAEKPVKKEVLAAAFFYFGCNQDGSQSADAILMIPFDCSREDLLREILDPIANYYCSSLAQNLSVQVLERSEHTICSLENSGFKKAYTLDEYCFFRMPIADLKDKLHKNKIINSSFTLNNVVSSVVKSKSTTEEQSSMAYGKFITFEGVDGSGKSTQIQHLKNYLESKGVKVECSREPGGCDAAEEIRNLLLKKNNNYDPITELFLFSAARREHITKKIIPSLKQGKWVICDRFIDSTRVYQSVVGHIDNQFIESAISLATASLPDDFFSPLLTPDLTIVLSLSGEHAYQRVIDRATGDKNRYEELSVANLSEINNAFKSLAQSNLSRYKLVEVTDLDELSARDEISRVVDFLIENDLKKIGSYKS